MSSFHYTLKSLTGCHFNLIRPMLMYVEFKGQAQLFSSNLNNISRQNVPVAKTVEMPSPNVRVHTQSTA